MKHDTTVSLTALYVQMQKTILQLTERVEALERDRKKATGAVFKARPRVKANMPAPDQPESVRDRLTMALICEKVATTHEVRVSDIRGPSRLKHIVAARKEACRLMLAEGFSSPMVGRFLGKRDHTSVLYLAGRLGKEGGKP